MAPGFLLARMMTWGGGESMSRTLTRVFLLVLVLVAGVSSFPPEASAQLMGATFWKQNNLLASDVVTASLTNTSASQTVTVETANSPPWTHIRIVACNWTSVEPSTKIFTNAAFNSQPTGCRIINTGSTTVATTLDSTFTVTATEISNGGVVVLMAAVGVTYTRFFYSEWVPILVPAIEVDPSTALNLTEQGTAGTYNVKLRTEPSGGVKVRVVSGNTAVTVNAGTTADIDFTTTNWNTTQAVTVTAVNDTNLIDETVTLTFSTVNASTSDEYDNVTNVTRTVNVYDNDRSPEFVTSAVSGTITEAGGSATFTVKLNTRPSTNLTTTLGNQDQGEGVVSPTNLNWNSNNWNTEQTVTVTGVNDDVDDGDQTYNIRISHSLGAPEYNGITKNVSVTTIDDDVAGITTGAVTGSLTEAGGTATFTVVLDSEPTANVTIAVSSGDPTEGTVLPSSLTFTAGNWNTSKMVTVTGADDNLDDGPVTWAVRVTPSSGDPKYNTPLLSHVDVSVTTTDDDTPAVMVDTNLTMPGAQATTLSVTEGATKATFTVQLATQPTAAVTVAVASQNTSEGTATPAALTFTAMDWNTAQPVTVTGVDDNLDDGPVTWAVRVTPSSGDPKYNTPLLSYVDVWVTTTDDDTPGLMIAPTALALEEATTNPATHMKTYTVKLASEPTAAVTVTVDNDDPSAVTVAPTTLTFTEMTWNTAQTVTVTAFVELDGDYRDEAVTLRHTVSSFDASYASLAADMRVTVDDKDTPPTLGPGEDTTINGHTVTVPATSAGETVTVIASGETDGAIEVVIEPAEVEEAKLTVADTRFSLGSSAVPLSERTVVNIRVRSNGQEISTLSAAERARVLGTGLTICLTVSPAVRAEARDFGRNVYLLHNRDGEWTVVADADVAMVEAQGNRLCATLMDFSPFVVAIDRGEEVTFKPNAQQSWTFLTGRAVREGALPGATGDGRITYTLTPVTLPLPAGLIYTPPGVGAEHGGTITGTPTTPTAAPREYTLTAMDVDREEVSLSITIEVKPGIQSRDLGLVLAGVGRTLASDAVEILGGRFGSSPASRLQVTLGGQVLRLTNPPASPSPSSPPPSPLSSSPSPLAGEGRGEGGVLRGEGSLLQSEAQESAARPAGSPSPWQQATGLALGVARALGVTINTPSPHSPSPLAGEGRGEGVFSGGEGGFLQNETSLLGRLPTDLRRGTTTASPLGLQPVSGKDLLARSAFELPLTRTGEDGVPAWTLWGRGSAAGFSGQPEAGFTMDGTLYSGYVGVDYRPQATMLLGLALAHSTGEVNYERTEATKAGADVELTSVLPYAHWQPRPGLGVWGLAGVGWGEMDLKLVGDPQTYTTRLTSWLGAVGGRQALTTWQGIDLAAKTDAFLTTVRSAGKTNLPAARGHAQRVRLLVEGRTAVDLSPVSRLEPRLELGGRWDNGTAEQGLGSELGGGVAYTRTDWGLSVDAQGRYLLLHEDGAFEDWGASVSVRLDPGVAGEGAYLTVAPVWGQASSGVEQLWGTAAVLPQARGPSQPATGWQPGSVEVDLGYGLALADGRGLVTPYGGLALAGPGSSRYRLGSRLALSSSLDVTLEGERAEQSGQKTAHGVSVRLGWQW